EPVVIAGRGDALLLTGAEGAATVPLTALRLAGTGFQNAGTLQVEWVDDGTHALVVSDGDVARLCEILPPDFATAARAVDARTRWASACSRRRPWRPTRSASRWCAIPR